MARFHIGILAASLGAILALLPHGDTQAGIQRYLDVCNKTQELAVVYHMKNGSQILVAQLENAECKRNYYVGEPDRLTVIVARDAGRNDYQLTVSANVRDCTWDIFAHKRQYSDGDC
jgi:hypothetical protein